MKRSRRSHYFLGFLAIVMGIGILFNSIGLMHFSLGHLFPFLIIYFALRLLDRGRRFCGSLLMAWGILLTLSIWFGVHIGDLFGLLFSIAVIYAGYRLVRKKWNIESPPPPQDSEPIFGFNPEKDHNQTHYRTTYSMGSHENKQSLIGNLFLTGSRWELKDMNIWHGIGEVKIDLSRAYIREGETLVVISGWIGDIDIYVPYDLEISLIANINAGDIDVFGNKQGGLNRSMSITTGKYHETTRKVRIIVSLLVGDIDIRYV